MKSVEELAIEMLPRTLGLPTKAAVGRLVTADAELNIAISQSKDAPVEPSAGAEFDSEKLIEDYETVLCDVSRAWEAFERARKEPTIYNHEAMKALCAALEAATSRLDSLRGLFV